MISQMPPVIRYSAGYTVVGNDLVERVETGRFLGRIDTQGGRRPALLVEGADGKGRVVYPEQVRA